MSSFSRPLQGKRSEWEGVVLVPFIDEKRLLAAIAAVDTSSLTKEELKRNDPGFSWEFVFESGFSEDYPSSLPKVFSGLFPSRSCAVAKNPPPPLPPGTPGFKPVLVPGTKTGVASPPGFPSLRSLKARNGSELTRLSVPKTRLVLPSPRQQRETHSLAFVKLTPPLRSSRRGFRTPAARCSARRRARSPSFSPSRTCARRGHTRTHGRQTLPYSQLPLPRCFVFVSTSPPGVAFPLGSPPRWLLMPFPSPGPSKQAKLTAAMVAPSVLGHPCYVQWPYVQEARVMAVSDARTGVTLQGQRPLSSDEGRAWEAEAGRVSGQFLTARGGPGRETPCSSSPTLPTPLHNSPAHLVQASPALIQIVSVTGR